MMRQTLCTLSNGGGFGSARTVTRTFPNYLAARGWQMHEARRGHPVVVHVLTRRARVGTVVPPSERVGRLP